MKTKTILSFLFSLIILSSILVVNAQSLEVTVSTTKTSYNRGDVITINGELLSDGQPTTGLVGVRVVNGQTSVAIRTVSAGTVSNPPGAITSAYLSDLSSNPLTSVQSGGLAYFTISVINNDALPRDLVAIVSVYDNNGVPLSSGGIKQEQFSTGTGFTGTVSLAIHSWATGGQAYAYAELYSNWPDQGGYPLAPETTIPFTLIGAAQGLNQPSTSSGSQGSYSLSFKLGPRALLGQNDVFISASSNGILASNLVSFYVHQLDFTGDNALDFNDLLAFSNNWVAAYSGQPWNHMVDINSDGDVNFNDLLLFSNAWVLYYSVG
ncbi:MAG: hypothetical protein ACQCN6_00270 [Candidatus Bathyarchaeia archaeon]|jgi:hypothetical protein